LGDIRVGDTSSIDHLKDQEVIIYCRSGNRSGQACMVLESLGFTNVINVSGGMLAWQDTFPG
jgi:rhodanese-related sulfurtransferase